MSLTLPIPAGELTPHAAPMLLLDEVTSCADGRITARVVIGSDNIFYLPGRGVPAYVGLEIMAQAIAAYDGWMRRTKNETPAIGFLLGCRRYETSLEWFQDGDVLEIEATSLIDEGELRSFACQIQSPGGAVLASSVLNVYRPTDAEAFLSNASPGASS